MTYRDASAVDGVAMAALGRTDVDLSGLSLAISLFGIEEDRTVKEPPRPRFNEAEKYEYAAAPPIRINLHVMICAPSEDYKTALQHLGRAIEFLQAHPFINRESDSELPVERLALELLPLSHEQQNHVWGMLGGRYLPSVACRVRVLTIDAGRLQATGAPVKDTSVGEAVR